MKELIKKYINNQISSDLKENLENNYSFMLNLIRETNESKYYFSCSDTLKENYEFIKELVFRFKTNKPFIYYICNLYFTNCSNLINYFELHIILTLIIEKPSTLEEKEYFEVVNNYYNEFMFSLKEELKSENINNLGFIYLFNRFRERKVILNFFVSKLLEEIFFNNSRYSFLEIIKLYSESDLKINNFLTNFIANYDLDLSWYIKTNLYLLDFLKTKFDCKGNGKVLEFKVNK